MSALTDSQRASKNVAHGAGMPLVTPRGDGSPTMLVPSPTAHREAETAKAHRG